MEHIIIGNRMQYMLLARWNERNSSVEMTLNDTICVLIDLCTYLWISSATENSDCVSWKGINEY